jgi:hypothetical protein
MLETISTYGWFGGAERNTLVYTHGWFGRITSSTFREALGFIVHIVRIARMKEPID